MYDFSMEERLTATCLIYDTMSYLYPCWLVPSKKAQGNTFVVVKEFVTMIKKKKARTTQRAKLQRRWDVPED